MPTRAAGVPVNASDSAAERRRMEGRSQAPIWTTIRPGSVKGLAATTKRYVDAAVRFVRPTRARSDRSCVRFAQRSGRVDAIAPAARPTYTCMTGNR